MVVVQYPSRDPGDHYHIHDLDEVKNLIANEWHLLTGHEDPGITDVAYANLSWTYFTRSSFFSGLYEISIGAMMKNNNAAGTTYAILRTFDGGWNDIAATEISVLGTTWTEQDSAFYTVPSGVIAIAIGAKVSNAAHIGRVWGPSYRIRRI